jgi:hypothetical protein
VCVDICLYLLVSVRVRVRVRVRVLVRVRVRVCRGDLYLLRSVQAILYVCVCLYAQMAVL